jgi:hypothetical protein
VADRKQRVIGTKLNLARHMRCVEVRVVVKHNLAFACHNFLEFGINLLCCVRITIDLIELSNTSTNSKP